jgi:hypothetical protein
LPYAGAAGLPYAGAAGLPYAGAAGLPYAGAAGAAGLPYAGAAGLPYAGAASFTSWVPTAPFLAPLQPLAATAPPMPVTRLAMLSPVTTFFRYFFSMLTSIDQFFLTEDQLPYFFMQI